MDLGSLSNYPLPALIRTAYGVDTAQQLADQLGVTKQPGAELGSQADAAYQALKTGDTGPARTLLIDKLGVSETKADEALAKLPTL
ncbi:hypothetical protein [Subtercola lobariae]|uniref:Uncharacterized protein n=1 Tax=Subtercola lobariae TaxID=1588641 RepID=A0A917BB02_9MICO|nr:hypothetical protein [Subtercola lobariae]GGF31849.1 hypothetical protein GCM10011399_26290 [Subtercola lobariae]